ncbi:MAG: AAA family ATPase, partial [Pseudomonadota bacterium]|nr:AAA family ATPase [Pseudomonadota bacterium]
MLIHLSITNLTLVNYLEIEFQAGMSAITGETGAGKSILLGALGLALGDRADSSLIAPGADRAEICASFDLSGHPEAIAWLNAKALNHDDHCILRRVISTDGRSRAFVNGSAMT